MCVYGGNIFKKFLLNNWAREAQIYMKAFWYSTELSLLKSWSLGVECQIYMKVFLHGTKSWPPAVRWSHNRENCFYMCLYRKNIFLNLLYNHLARKAQYLIHEIFLTYSLLRIYWNSGDQTYSFNISEVQYKRNQ
jgi:hypothetical protein